MMNIALSSDNRTVFLLRYKNQVIPIVFILLGKTTAVKNEAALSHYRLRGLYFLAVVFVRSIDQFTIVSQN